LNLAMIRCRAFGTGAFTISTSGVAHQGESVAVACFTEDLDEDISVVNRAQKRQMPKASEGDEMQMPLSAAANPFVGHGTEKSKPRPFKRLPSPAVKNQGWAQPHNGSEEA